jgi:hypothetical protein
MPAGVALARDEAGRIVPGPTSDRPGVSRWEGAGGTLELLRSGYGVWRAASWRVRREPRAKEAGPTEAWRDEENAPRVGRPIWACQCRR